MPHLRTKRTKKRIHHKNICRTQCNRQTDCKKHTIRLKKNTTLCSSYYLQCGGQFPHATPFQHKIFVKPLIKKYKRC